MRGHGSQGGDFVATGVDRVHSLQIATPGLATGVHVRQMGYKVYKMAAARF